MTPVTEHRDLVGLVVTPGMTTLALDLDGRDRPRVEQVEVRLHELLRRAERLAGDTGDPELAESVKGDVARIRTRFGEGFDRSTTHGVIFSSCSACGLFEVREFPVAVRDQVRVGPRPFLLALEAAEAACAPVVVVLADRERARLFELRGDVLTEVQDLFEWVPPRVESGGWAAARGQRHSDTVAHRHLQHAAQAASRLLDRHPGCGLLLGGPQRARLDLEELLDPQARRHPIGHVSVRLTAADNEVREAVVSAAAELAARDPAIDRVVESLRTGRRAFAGLEATLDSLAVGDVETLLIERNFTAPGARCAQCGALATPRVDCVRCGAALIPEDDITEAVIDGALTLGATVHVVTPGALGAWPAIAGLRHHAREA